ncbi:MAG: hypothetical protein RLZZ267_188 [Bacillota bacterium]
MQLEYFRFSYGLINGLILVTAIYLSWYTYGLRRTVFLWLAVKAVAALSAIGLTTKWLILEIDWLLTTPITVYILFVIANHPQRMRRSLMWFPLVWCTVMAVGGVFAEWQVGQLKWLWFGLAAGSMGVIFWRLWMLQKEAIHRSYAPLMRFNLVMWSLFPLVWLGGKHGLQWISNEQAIATFTLLDGLTKGGFFLFVVWLMREEIANDMEKGRSHTY